MAAAAGLSVTLAPILMGAVIRGRLPGESQNPLNRWLIAGYRPPLDAGDLLYMPKSREVKLQVLTEDASANRGSSDNQHVIVDRKALFKRAVAQ